MTTECCNDLIFFFFILQLAIIVLKSNYLDMGQGQTRSSDDSHIQELVGIIITRNEFALLAHSFYTSSSEEVGSVVSSVM